MDNVRLMRLTGGDRRVVVIAVDHGEFMGPIPGLVDLPRTLGMIDPTVDGVLLSPAMIPRAVGLFGFKGAPLAVARLNWSSVYCFQWGYQLAATVAAFSPKEAVRLGADAVLISLTLDTGNERQDAANVAVFRKLCAEAKELGLPVIGEVYPAKSDMLSPEELHSKVLVGARIVAELGADLIKTFYTVRFAEVVEASPVPVLGLGAEKRPTQLEALQLAADQVAAGARGVVFGRNAFQVPNPTAFQRALCDVVKHDLQPEKAVQKYGLIDTQLE